jgi:hypothetical protein
MKGLSVKLDPLEPTARYWVGQSKQGKYLRKRTNGRLSLMFIFHRLKINHGSHEFILEFGTVVNSYRIRSNSPSSMPIKEIGSANPS